MYEKMNNTLLYIFLIVGTILFFLNLHMYNQWYAEQEKEQLAECDLHGGYFASTGILNGASCLVDGEQIMYLNTESGWKMIIKDAPVEVDE